jgi:hypothetical protein
MACRASLLAISVLGAGNAFAQCIPNPSQSGQAITCTGTQGNGYTVATDQSPLTVTAGSSIQNSGDALTVSIPAVYYYQSRTAAITVQGSIVSTGGSGILVSSGMPYQGNYDFNGTYGSISVAAGGSISGITGITISPYPGSQSTFAAANFSLDNAGTITGTITGTGTGGAALVSSSGFYNNGFSSINNEAGALLGGVAAAFNNLTNAGTIDGGNGSAIAPPTNYYFQDSVTNHGTIQAEGAAATIQSTNNGGVTNSGTIVNSGTGAAITGAGSLVNLSGGSINALGSDVVTGSYVSVSNYGSIANLGIGQAISGTSSVNVTNYAGATISAGSSGTAINAANSINLVNSGTINGDVLAGSSSSPYQSNYVDSTLGTINGNLTFGAGQNTLVAVLSNGALLTGITGTITGGTGSAATNTLDVTTTSDATLSSGTTLPANFTQLAFLPGAGTTLTLGNGFSAPGPIIDNGGGTLANATTLSGNGQIITMAFGSSVFNNSGTIISNNLGGASAISLSGYATVQNSGTITAAGDGISGSGYAISNTGTISAGGTALAVFLQGGINNSGSITSTAGTAVNLSQSCTCATATNSGTISGLQVGIDLQDGILVNTGTISSQGIGVELNNYATINNQVGGIIGGGSLAITNPNGTGGGDKVINAGTINGDVDLASNFFASNIYVAVTGGILNGNLTLGVGDMLVTDFANPGTGAFAGISGTVTANQSNLIYNVTQDGTASAPSAGFASVEYQLSNNPTLTIAAGSTQTGTLVLAGTGSAIINGDVTTSNAAGLSSTNYLTFNGSTANSTALTISNNGNIVAARTDPSIAPFSAVNLGASDTLTNNGTIAMSDTTGGAYTGYYGSFSEAAVSGGKSITNAGTISGVGASAVSLGSFYGSSQPSLTNSGTITSDETTIIVNNSAPIVNSGTISSSGGAAIAGPAGNAYYFYYSSAQVNNLAGGTISGSTDAIDLSGGMISNAGTINGNVNLAYVLDGYPNQSSGEYVDNGGTLNGNLTLNAYDALVIDLAKQGSGPLGGVTGTINANGGSLIYQVNSSITTSSAPANAGFGTTGYLLANNATLTFDSSSQQATPVALGGTGTVILNGSITAADASGVVTQPPAFLAALGYPGTTNALSVTNNGTISVGADANWFVPVAVSLASTDTLVNNGTIAIADSVVPTSFYPSAAVSGGLLVTNTGTITGTNVSAIAPGAALVNSGTITSNVQAITLVGITDITNSGTIASTGAIAIGGNLVYSYNSLPANVTNLAGGIISGVSDAIDLSGGTVVNAGTINGNVNLDSLYGYYGAGGYYDNGGTLNGDLTLTYGQALLVNYGSSTGPLGGVTGTINANGAALLYNIGGDTTVAAAAPSASGFTLVGYQLSNNATLTVPSGIALTSTLALAGTGSVVLGGTITTNDQPGVQSTIAFAPINSSVSTQLAITNNGTIATTSDIPYLTGLSAVSLGSGDTLVNTGTISLTDVTGLPGSFDAAVIGGASVTNTGTITGSGVGAIQTGTGFNSQVLLNTLTNSGTISSDRIAVQVIGSTSINNSGTISSSGAAAISSTNYYYYPYATGNSRIVNQAGGTIAGVGDAIDIIGGSVSNAGTINGNVNLAYSPYGNSYYGSGAYFNIGGTLNGDLTITNGQQLVTPLGSYNGTGFAGITGTVNSSNASLLYLVGNDATTTFAVPTGFANVSYDLSNSATLTLTGDNNPDVALVLSGNGAVNFTGTIATTDTSAIYSTLPTTLTGVAPANTLAITNNGTLTTTLDAQLSYYVNYSPFGAISLGANDSFTNNGSVTLTNTTGLIFPTTVAAVIGGQSLINAGTIVGIGASAVNLGNSTPGQALTLTNSGSISSDQTAILLAAPTVVTNSGTIFSSAGAAITGSAAATGTLIDNQATGMITGSMDAIDMLGGTVANAGTINGNVDLAHGAVAGGALTGGYFANGGTLNGNLTLGQGQVLFANLSNAQTGPFGGISGTITATNASLAYGVTATTTTTAILHAGFTSLSYQLSNNSILTLAADSSLSTTLGLAGSGTVIFDGSIATTDAVALQSQPLLIATGASTTPNALSIINNGSISSSAGIGVLNAGPGVMLLTNNAGGVISGGTDAVDIAGGVVSNAGTITGNVNLGYGAANAAPAIYIANGGTLTGNLAFASTGGGNELVETGSGFGVSGTITAGPGANTVGHLRSASATLTLLGTLPDGFGSEYTVAQGAGTLVTIKGAATSTANIFIGGNGAIVNQANTSGIVEDLAASGESYFASQGLQLGSVTNTANVGGIAISTARLSNSGTVGSANATATAIAQTSSVPLSFTNSGTINGGIAINATNYTLVDTAGGAINGNIAIHAGSGSSGSITLAGGFAGSIDGSAGATTSLAVSGGSATRPITFGNIANIASYSQGGGYATLGGTASLGTAVFTGGSFVGLVGSILNASQINVASGADFASGGTINGNLVVGGTLRVGASPDVLTVKGNVALASGSTSVFEVSPTASSKLVVSGTVAIASNATLQIVQLQPLTPGMSIDLIQAAGGITGAFTTLTGITGAIVEKGNDLSVLALFDTTRAANPQVAGSVNYLNTLIRNGGASPALVAALPVLQTAAGAPATGAFARLTPQAYASATQIGVENGLMLSRAMRELGWDSALHSGHVFTFGQALGNWRGIAGNAGLGTSHADLSGYGFLGGIGIGTTTASIAAFGGYLNQTEDIAALAASTHARGFVGGVTGRLASGPARLDVSLIYDDAHATTRRLSPDAISLAGYYKLHGWTIDGQASTSFALGSGIAARPHVGATWVWTRRGATVEDNASAFALTVAGDHHNAGFIDGGVRFEPAPNGTSRLSPFLDLGIRYQVEGRTAVALAGLSGGPVALFSDGVRRSSTSAAIAGGANYRATDAVTLFVTGSGDLSRGNNSGAVTGGVKVTF